MPLQLNAVTVKRYKWMFRASSDGVRNRHGSRYFKHGSSIFFFGEKVVPEFMGVHHGHAFKPQNLKPLHNNNTGKLYVPEINQKLKKS